MKLYLGWILFSIIGCVQALSQNIPAIDSCHSYKKIAIQAFIPGERDTILSPGELVKTIIPSSLINGFYLQLKDSSYKIIRFHLSFDHGYGSISEMPSVGNKMAPRNDSIVSLNKILEATIITIDRIFVTKNNACYIIPVIFYITPNSSRIR